ncbi:glycosyltransferase [Psychrilyobacter sp.]|uniref:glycosyltransferase n=1 Tax=Psychrilyobacter sp. TaxID=2586924 RepID=UPI003019E75E
MNICFTPHKSMRNQYINLFTSSLENKKIKIYGLKEVLTDFKKFKTTKIFHFNWFLKVNSKNKIINILEYLFKFILLFILKTTGKKVVYTLHNKLPHDAKKNIIVKKLNRFLLKCSDRIVVHCYDDSLKVLREELSEKEIQKKVRYIEHGNYIDAYPEKQTQELRERLKIKDDEKVFLFLGSVEPYKNTHLLIKAFNELNFENVKLVIAGNPKSDEYRARIKDLSKNSNIYLELRFIEDEELSMFLNVSDLVILPYSNESSLNSGSVFLAFSYKKTVISSNIGTLNDIRRDFYYSYNYGNEKEHIEKLKSNMSLVKKELESDSKVLLKKGLTAYEYVSKNNNWEDISQKMFKIYNEFGVNDENK